MELFRDPAHVAQPARVVGQDAELEAVVGEHDERRVAVERGEEVAEDPVGCFVDRLDGMAEPLLLLRELADQALGAEEMAEEVRRGVGALEVDHHQIGALGPPEVEADVAVGAQRREDPAEVLQVVVEVERAGELGGGDVDVRREVREPDLIGRRHPRAQARLELGRIGSAHGAIGAAAARLLEPLREEEMPGQPVAGDETVHRLRGIGRPPARAHRPRDRPRRRDSTAP